MCGPGPQRALLLGDDLVDGVERKVLRARDAVQLLGRDQPMHVFENGFGPIVPVRHGFSKETSIVIQHPVVHAPAINGDGLRLRDPAQSGQDHPVEPVEVPAQMTVSGDRGVRDPLDLSQLDPFRRHCAGHDSRTRSAEVDGREDPRRHVQRKNAAATPASTGTKSPVVWLNSSETRAATAEATC